MEINEIVAKNLTAYRKQMGLTQAELAEKIHYSDKSISKWERAECIPDLAILKQLADFYGITVNDFLNESLEIKSVKQKKKFLRKQIIVPTLSVGLAWFVAILVFVGLWIFNSSIKESAWLCFIYALPVSAIILIVFACVWKLKIVNFITISALLWTLTLSIYLSVPFINTLWLLFLIPTILEVLLILWFFLRIEIKEKIIHLGKSFAKNKKQKDEPPKQKDEENK